MAILCLADDMADLKDRLGKIIVAYDYDNNPVTADDLHATGAMAALLKDAIKPNLVQTLENTPAIVHGGPFANIAHGCNSVRATKTAMKMADIVVTEAGFGADLGAEKFLDIKCRLAGLKPDAIVIVATVRALKYNGGVPKDQLSEENMEALRKGIANLDKHIENMHKYNVPVVVTLNSFITTRKKNTISSENTVRSLDVNLHSPRYGLKAAEEERSLHRKSFLHLRISLRNISLSTRMNCHLKKRLRRSQRKYTVPEV